MLIITSAICFKLHMYRVALVGVLLNMQLPDSEKTQWTSIKLLIRSLSI